MKTIILPVDFSETTKVLLDYTINFAKDINARVLLIHIAPADIGFVIGDMGYQYFPEVEDSEMKYELKELKNLETQIIAAGIPTEHVLKQGTASDMILEHAKENNADYIVMGSHGRSGMYDVFIGSLTKNITKRSAIPVLVVPCHN